MSELQQVIDELKDLRVRIEALEAKVFPVQEPADGGPNTSIMYGHGNPLLDQSPPTQVLKSN